MNDIQGDVGSLALGASPILDSVVQVGDGVYSCTGTLISATAVATARHCTDAMTTASLSVTFTSGAAPGSYNAASVTAMAADASDPTNFFNGTDMSIITLSTAVTGYTPFEVLTWDALPLFEEPTLFSGYGSYGIGSTGATSPGDGQRRAAQNTFDALGIYNLADGRTNLMFESDFDDGTEANNTYGSATPLANEGLVGAGDSGGPLLMYREGSWVLSGVLTGVRYTDGFGDGDYGDIGSWTAFYSNETKTLLTDAGATFFTPAVPLPATAWLMLGAFGVVGAARRRKTAA